MKVKISYEIELQERRCEIFPDGSALAHAGERVYEIPATKALDTKLWCEAVWLRAEGSCGWHEANGSLLSDRFVRVAGSGAIPNSREMDMYYYTCGLLNKPGKAGSENNQ